MNECSKEVQLFGDAAIKYLSEKDKLSILYYSMQGQGQSLSPENMASFCVCDEDMKGIQTEMMGDELVYSIFGFLLQDKNLPYLADYLLKMNNIPKLCSEESLQSVIKTVTSGNLLYLKARINELEDKDVSFDHDSWCDTNKGCLKQPVTC